MLQGAEEEHAVLLANYFLYLGYKAWIVIGNNNTLIIHHQFFRIKKLQAGVIKEQFYAKTFERTTRIKRIQSQKKS